MTDALILLFAAFAVVWVGLFLYLLYLDRQTQAVSEQLQELSSALSRGEQEVGSERSAQQG